jgi:hypothetical protein
MLRNTYVRLTQYRPPTNTTVGHLHLLAMVSEPIHIFEGTLIEDIRVEHDLRLQTAFFDGVAKRERLRSTPILRIESGYILSERSLYQILRVPPYRQKKMRRA